MVPEFKNEIDRIANGSDKIGDKRIGKSPTAKFIGSLFEIDIDDATNRWKKDAKRRALRAAGEILTSFINAIFNSPPTGVTYQQSSPTVIRRGDNLSYMNYKEISNGQPVAAPKGSKYTFPDLIYESWDDAEKLRLALNDVLLRDRKVSVAKLYDILDDPSNLSMTDGMIGWTDLSGAYVGMEGDHYRLYLPKVESIS